MTKKKIIPNETDESPSREPGGLPECDEECKKTCKRHFWTEVLRTLVKIGTAVLAAFGIASCIEED